MYSTDMPKKLQMMYSYAKAQMRKVFGESEKTPKAVHKYGFCKTFVGEKMVSRKLLSGFSFAE